jgi:hypothetical protein
LEIHGPFSKLKAFWADLPNWQKWLLLALAGVWTICLVVAGSLLTRVLPGG